MALSHLPAVVVWFKLVGGEEATTFANLRFIELQFVSQKSVKRQHLHVSADVAGSRLQVGNAATGDAIRGRMVSAVRE